jgi:hypothetical protein
VNIIFERSLAVALGRNRSCSKKTNVRTLLDVLQKFVDDLGDNSDFRCISSACCCFLSIHPLNVGGLSNHHS